MTALETGLGGKLASKQATEKPVSERISESSEAPRLNVCV